MDLHQIMSALQATLYVKYVNVKIKNKIKWKRYLRTFTHSYDVSDFHLEWWCIAIIKQSMSIYGIITVKNEDAGPVFICDWIWH